MTLNVSRRIRISEFPASHIDFHPRKSLRKYHSTRFQQSAFPTRAESIVLSNRYLHFFFLLETHRCFICIGTHSQRCSRTMKLHFRKSNRGPGASSQLHCLYECANNGTTHFLREYILTISNRSRTCRQANTRDSADMYGSSCIKSTNSRRLFSLISLAPLRASRKERFF